MALTLECDFYYKVMALLASELTIEALGRSPSSWEQTPVSPSTAWPLESPFNTQTHSLSPRPQGALRCLWAVKPWRRTYGKSPQRLLGPSLSYSGPQIADVSATRNNISSCLAQWICGSTWAESPHIPLPAPAESPHTLPPDGKPGQSLSSCISLLSSLTVLHCPWFSAWKKLLHIFCPVL